MSDAKDPGSATRLTLALLPGCFAIVRLPAGTAIPPIPLSGPLFSVTRTAAEISIVCLEVDAPSPGRADTGWRAFQVEGPLDFGLTGVLASITSPLAAAAVPIFALSTFDTDYILVRNADALRAIAALREAGHTVGAAEDLSDRGAC